MDAAVVPEPEAPLPESVWALLVAVTADALPDLDTLPPALRRVAAFSPPRRARLGATPISLALTRDEAFRVAVAEQVTAPSRGESPALAAAVRDGSVPAGADASEAAALTWLLRPDGWEAALAGLLDRVEAQAEARRETEAAAEADRLRGQLAESERGQREHRARVRAQTDALKAENASLRRKLGDARSAVRAAEAAADGARTEAQAATTSARTASTTAEAEVRRLRARVAELEEAAGAGRRDVRARRDDTSLRSRLLLDALLEAGQGLRRELGLPAAEGAPADRLEGELAGSETTAPTTSGAPVSALLLEGWLQIPRARLLVDGYNVSKAAWPEASLDVQRSRLTAVLAPLVSRNGVEATVVFDAAASTARPPVNPPRGLKVLFSPPGVIADDVLRDLVAVEPAGRTVVVVSSDREVMSDVRRAGARAVPSEVLLELLGR